MALTVVTTVTTPATSYNLIDLAAAKAEFQLTSTKDDDWLTQTIPQVSKMIANECRRVFPVETVTNQFIHEGERRIRLKNTGNLVLSRYPVVSVASVTECGVVLTENVDFIVDYQNGLVIRTLAGAIGYRFWNNPPIIVSYTAGYPTIPDDLVGIALRILSMRYRQRSRDPLLKSQSAPQTGDQQYWVGGMPGQSGPFPPDIQAYLDRNYRDLRFT